MPAILLKNPPFLARISASPFLYGAHQVVRGIPTKEKLAFEGSEKNDDDVIVVYQKMAT